MIRRLKKLNFSLPWWFYWIFFIVTGLAILANEDNFKDSDWFAVAILSYYFSLFLVTSRWIFNQIKKIINLRKEKLRIESIHLQNQVNPHFFFNTLNNLYGWVGKDPNQAQKMILKLSDMMRYSIYQGQEEYVSLEDEMAYIEKYIELHQMRYLKNIDIQFTKNVLDATIGIRPLLFIILVENAFKHGVENLRENIFVNIDLSSDESNIIFTVENNFDPEIEDKRAEAGIGLANLKKRLQLSYPKNHHFETMVKDDVFTSKLIINLK